MLAAGLAGIRDELELQPPEEGLDLFSLSRQELRDGGIGTLPESLGEAVEIFAESELMRETLGDHIHSYIVSAKRAEWNEYQGVVSALGDRALSGGAVMKSKTVIFIADSLDNAHKFQQVLSASTSTSRRDPPFSSRSSSPSTPITTWSSTRPAATPRHGRPSRGAGDRGGSSPMLVIVNEGQLADFRLPVQIKADFVVHGASPTECAVRIGQLLWPGSEATSSDVIVVDDMTINLATYQVKVADEPLDFTYLEYALLAFLVTHPGRTYSRDALLRPGVGLRLLRRLANRRRPRAPRARQARPELAQHLETVRGVGYLWNS